MSASKIVYWAENQIEADLLCGMLQECGIPCRQLKESVGRTLGLQFGIFGEIAISVPESRAAEAEAIILDWDAPAEEPDEGTDEQ